jgi:CheY-like chemotaxis protein
MITDLRTGRPGYLLLVDDDDDVRELVAAYLRGAGRAVVTAGDGQHALDLVAREPAPPALILLDLEMPVLDGPGFLARRAAHAALAVVPVIVVSGAIDAADRVRTFAVVAVHGKPVRPSELAVTIATILAG